MKKEFNTTNISRRTAVQKTPHRAKQKFHYSTGKSFKEKKMKKLPKDRYDATVSLYLNPSLIDVLLKLCEIWECNRSLALRRICAPLIQPIRDGIRLKKKYIDVTVRIPLDPSFSKDFWENKG